MGALRPLRRRWLGGYPAPVIREDYLRRTIRQIAEAVARLLGLARTGRNELAEQQLSQLYLDHLGMPREAVALLAPESLAQVLGARAPIAAELLRAEAELKLSAGSRATRASCWPGPNGLAPRRRWRLVRSRTTCPWRPGPGRVLLLISPGGVQMSKTVFTMAGLALVGFAGCSGSGGSGASATGTGIGHHRGIEHRHDDRHLDGNSDGGRFARQPSSTPRWSSGRRPGSPRT